MEGVLLPAGPQDIPQAQQGLPCIWCHQCPSLSPVRQGLPEDSTQVQGPPCVPPQGQRGPEAVPGRGLPGVRCQVLDKGAHWLLWGGGGLFDGWAPWSEEGSSAGPPAGWGATQPHEHKYGAGWKNATRADACCHWWQVGEGGRVPLWGVTDSRWAGGGRRSLWVPVLVSSWQGFRGTQLLKGPLLLQRIPSETPHPGST